METTRRAKNTLHRKRGVGSAQFNRPTERMRAENTGKSSRVQTHRTQEVFVPAVLPQTKCPAVTRWPTALLGSCVLSFFTHPLLAALLAHHPLPLHHFRRSPNHKGSLLHFRPSLLQDGSAALPTHPALTELRGELLFCFTAHHSLITDLQNSISPCSQVVHAVCSVLGRHISLQLTPHTNTLRWTHSTSALTCTIFLGCDPNKLGQHFCADGQQQMHEHFSAHNQTRECWLKPQGVINQTARKCSFCKKCSKYCYLVLRNKNWFAYELPATSQSTTCSQPHVIYCCLQAYQTLHFYKHSCIISYL